MQIIVKVRRDVAEEITDINLAGKTGQGPGVFEESVVELVVNGPLALEYKQFFQYFLNDSGGRNDDALIRFPLNCAKNPFTVSWSCASEMERSLLLLEASVCTLFG